MMPILQAVAQLAFRHIQDLDRMISLMHTKTTSENLPAMRKAAEAIFATVLMSDLALLYRENGVCR